MAWYYYNVGVMDAYYGHDMDLESVPASYRRAYVDGYEDEMECYA